MSFNPTTQSATALTPIPETTPTFVAPPPAPVTTSPLKQLRAPPVPFVPRSELYLSSPSPPSDVEQLDFCNCRPEAPAVFSTKNGTRAKRKLVHPFPAPIIRTDLLGDVDIRSNQLLEEFPEARNIFEVPNDWFMLHRFFDGHDIWVEGANFCYYVILAICRKNNQRVHVTHAQRVEIDTFARDWVLVHIDVVISSLNVKKMTTLFNEADRAELVGMTEAEIVILNQGLDYHRQHYMEFLAQERLPPMESSQPFPHHGHQIHSQELYAAPVSGTPFSRTPMGPATMPQAHRVRQDSITLMPIRAANDQQLARRGSMQGPQGRQVQGYGSVVDTRRQITPNGHRTQGYANEYYNMNGSMRQRGLSNSSQNARGRDFSYNSLQGSNRRYPKDFGGRPSGNTPSKEPIYVRQMSPPNAAHISAADRVVSDPAPIVPFYSAKRVGSGNRQVISPLNRERKFHNTQAMSTSPTNNGDPRTPRQYPSGSSAPQGPRILPSSPTNRKPHGNDARINATLEQEYPWMEQHDTNSSQTLHYRPGLRDFESVRTLHVSGFHEAMFYNHHLKELMEECGKVISIHFLPLGAPRAFVTFVESGSVQRAILRYNQAVLPSGYKLSAGLPNNLDRPRAGSNASQNYRNWQYNSSRDFEPRSRRPSFRNSSNDYHTGTNTRRTSVIQNPNTPPGLLIDQLRSTITEVVQHHSALERNSHKPLGSIENTHNPSKAVNGSFGIHQQGMTQTANNTKENVSPSNKAGSQENRENVSPRKNASNKKGNYKHQKGSKQNTSTRPTPAVTPVKSNSVVNLKEVGQLQVSTDLSKSSIGDGGRTIPRNGVKKNSFKPKNIHDSSKSDGSFNTDATSDAALSPLESAPMTRDTSFSAGSDRKHSQDPSSKITKSQSAVDMPGLAAGAGASKTKSKKGNKSRGQKQTPSEVNEQAKIVEDSVGSSKGIETEGKKDNETVMGHSKKGSGASMGSNKSLRKADLASVKVVTNQAQATLSSPEGKTEGKLEVTTSSAAPVDPASVISETPSPQVNDKEWPSLTKSPVMGSDAERLPPPVMGPLTSVPSSNKKSIKPAVPAVAVPRAFETRIQQPLRGYALGLDVGTETWPFVRKCKAK
ncbi:hypothetical protein DL98DRAFT_580377 [Cadophora sp. DSE1049]|nr:hypothetical protein DL98DRAFT_580377 [Cadophora sp. DSE1049]